MLLSYSFLVFSIFSSWVGASTADHGVAEPRAGKPNIVFILTDDQDKHLDSMDYMKSVQKHLVAEGTSFERHYCTVALCCPSRVNLLTGRLAHNTKVTDLRLPFGKHASES